MSALRYRNNETTFPLEARLRRTLKRTPIGDLAVGRRFQAYGVGIERTGTTFLASVLGQDYRAEHEIEWYFLADTFTRRNALDDEAICRWLDERDRTLRLEFESCHLLGPFVKYLVDLFPEAKFILTIRHPLPWLLSVTNWALRHNVLRPDGPWKPVMDCYYADPKDPPMPIYYPEAWHDMPLYSVDGYLNGWKRHNHHILSHVPEDRLLVLPTPSLSERLDDVANVFDLDAKLTAMPQTDRNNNPKKQDLLADLDQDRLQEKIGTYCGDLIDRFDLSKS